MRYGAVELFLTILAEIVVGTTVVLLAPEGALKVGLQVRAVTLVSLPLSLSGPGGSDGRKPRGLGLVILLLLFLKFLPDLYFQKSGKTIL